MKPQFHLPLSTSPEASSFTIIENAVQFCANQNADLVASISVPRRVNRLHSEAAVGDDTFQAERFARGAGAQLVEHLRDRAGRASVDVRLVRFEAEATSACQTLAELARAYDLSVLENSEIARPVIENMLFESGRPVLLLPPEDFYGRIDIVALAFDGSATIARAASGAYPLMQSATKAIVISVLDGAQPGDALLDRYGESLRHAGLEVEIARVHCEGADVPCAIQDAAIEARADLLIAGAYGQSKLREAILGGVTRGLLGNLRIPTLLSH